MKIVIGGPKVLEALFPIVIGGPKVLEALFPVATVLQKFSSCVIRSLTVPGPIAG